jgi:hypothetical protein
VVCPECQSADLLAEDVDGVDLTCVDGVVSLVGANGPVEFECRVCGELVLCDVSSVIAS